MFDTTLRLAFAALILGIAERAVDLNDRMKTLNAKYHEKIRRAKAATTGTERP